MRAPHSSELREMLSSPTGAFVFRPSHHASPRALSGGRQLFAGLQQPPPGGGGVLFRDRVTSRGGKGWTHSFQFGQVGGLTSLKLCFLICQMGVEEED